MGERERVRVGDGRESREGESEREILDGGRGIERGDGSVCLRSRD